MNTDLKILLADDLPAVRKILKRILTQLGFKSFVEADDGISAWEIIESQQIDLIIADWVMPRMTGIELLKKIRSSKPHKSTPFLMLTGEANKDQIVEALNEGVSSYVVKPFTAEIISEKLKKIIEQSEG